MHKGSTIDLWYILLCQNTVNMEIMGDPLKIKIKIKVLDNPVKNKENIESTKTN